ncbi:methyl-accepting chemotaxis protein [Allochromatium vinosum]|uniref:Methyl-accepting chemotaxis sensory transducer with Cache sensor n=1 Tax=Allochromatium vinosum (strain ATCC 17899 / DSM 180 / NBRC 103801 / NCIMB 10441 / D) TaxID=572477 RepID=D3RRV4_ALLVD|nr:methyl-accepting chemotaxis protein [Allochromatium vinosum]ADC62008.1 methyl-accepting chemotaxis sensory transducer with Cache sensor [Allochromatium vinosum DSM 180]
MRTLSLRLKLLLVTGMILVLTAGTIILLATLIFRESIQSATDSMTLNLSRQAEEIMSETALGTRQEIQRLLASAIASASVLQRQVTSSALGAGETAPYGRDQLKRLVLDTLASNPFVSSAYAQFEPNGYDGRDSEYAGNLAHSSNTGTIEIYFTREGDSFVFHETEDPGVKYLETLNEHGQREAEWYLCPKERRQTCITDPYLYEINPGHEELMTSLTLPLVVDQTFIGVVGMDINLAALQTAGESIAKRLFRGQGDLMLVSQQGLIAASTRFPDQLGKRVSDVAPELATAMTTPGQSKSGDRWLHSLAIPIANTSWTLSISVAEADILAAARELEQDLRADARTAVLKLAAGAAVMTILGLAVMVILIRSVIQPLAQLAQGMRALASSNGDLTAKVMVHHHVELIELSKNINRFIDKLRQMILVMREQSQTLAGRSADLSDYARQVGQASATQNAQIDNVATAMTQMSSTAGEVANIAHQTADASREAADHIDQTQQALNGTKDRVGLLSRSVEEASSQMHQVAERSRAIDGILVTIREIAGRTNLLALNAAIEAARAGEQGRGFAVVAEEVRHLAMRTQDSTKDVDDLIKGLQGDVQRADLLLQGSRGEMEQTLTFTHRSAELLDRAVLDVRRIDSHAQQVATAAEEQSQVSEEINRSLTAIGDAARDLAHLAQVSEAAALETHDAIRTLDDQLNLLRV